MPRGGKLLALPPVDMYTACKELTAVITPGDTLIWACRKPVGNYHTWGIHITTTSGLDITGLVASILAYRINTVDNSLWVDRRTIDIHPDPLEVVGILSTRLNTRLYADPHALKHKVKNILPIMGIKK